jgi:hypothetical protein
MILVSKLDEFGKAAWIAAAVFGFWAFWPIGLAVILFLAWSGRMREWRLARGQWRGMDRAEGFRNMAWGSSSGVRGTPSGNRAFDEYRAETLRRLEDEQREFVEYLERLRQAKDKAEFDGFMAERRRGPVMTDPQRV